MNLNVVGHTDDIEGLRERVARIERRLELTDKAPPTRTP